MRRRVFLNLPGNHSIGMIYAYVDRKGEDTVELKIADCNRVIDLNFSDYEVEQRENSLHKINTLVEVLSQFRDALIKRYEEKDRKAKG